MTCDRIQLLWFLAQHAGSCFDKILVAGAMEAVTPDVMLLIIFVRQAVHVCIVWHGLVVGCVKHTDLEARQMMQECVCFR